MTSCPHREPQSMTMCGVCAAVEIAAALHYGLPRTRRCDTCARATAGKTQYSDPEWFCDNAPIRSNGRSRRLSDAEWPKALRWQAGAMTQHFAQSARVRLGKTGEYSATLNDDATDCPYWHSLAKNETEGTKP